jgi:hypothetical protein
MILLVLVEIMKDLYPIIQTKKINIRKMCRKPCKECPWKNENQHSLSFRKYSEKMESIGKIENHSCHMINKDVWGYKTKINEKNVCIGSLNNKK